MWFRRLGLVMLIVLAGVTSARYTPARAANGRYFPQTGFAIADPAFQDFFDHRGGVNAFGYPVSREFTFLGFPVQIFQRAVMQRFPNGSVQLLNLLDDSLFPYTEVNGATFPAEDVSLTHTAPAVGTPGYNLAVLHWISLVTPDRWNGMPVAFHQSFLAAVPAADAFPGRRVDPGLLTAFDLQVMGLPTSRPAFDPNNTRFVYQRFQRGILHYDQRTGTTEGILLADYFKDILMDENLPPDLAAEAKTSPYFGQYNPLMPQWVNRPAQLPNTDLTRAFEPSPVIVLDPGHGGQEIGASFTFSDGLVLQEKNLNLIVATETAGLLRQAGFTVVQTRTTDSWVDANLKDVDGDGKVTLRDDLQSRIDLANAAHGTLFLSIHFNGYADPSVRGTTIYYDADRPFSDRSEYFANLLDREAVSALANLGFTTVDRGVQTDSTAVGYGEHFYVLGPDAVRPSQMPGALAEGLFLTSPVDAAQLRKPQTLQAFANAYARAIEDYYGRAR
jgi:N-acetylmuramoyl-L-alanine amidase